MWGVTFNRGFSLFGEMATSPDHNMKVSGLLKALSRDTFNPAFNDLTICSYQCGMNDEWMNGIILWMFYL